MLWPLTRARHMGMSPYFRKRTWALLQAAAERHCTFARSTPNYLIHQKIDRVCQPG